MDQVDKAVLASIYASSLDPSISAYERLKARLPVNIEFFKSRIQQLGKSGFVEKDDPSKLTFIGRDALKVVLVGGVFDLIPCLNSWYDLPTKYLPKSTLFLPLFLAFSTVCIAL